MKALFASLAFAIFIAACQSNQTNNKAVITESQGTADTLKPAPFRAFLDSLSDYSGPDSVFRFPDYQVYAGRINGIPVRLVETSDTSTIIYQWVNTSWFITDTLHCSFIFITASELNGDNYNDLIVTMSDAGMGSNTQNVCLLYYPIAKLFRHNKYFDLPNIRYNKNNNTVFSAWFTGAIHPQQKLAYQISGDTLQLKEGALYEMDETSDGEVGTVTLYKIIKGKMVITKKIKGKSEKTSAIFDKALWDYSAE